MELNERKIKLQRLLSRQKLKEQKQVFYPLFEECLAALGDGSIVFSPEKTEEIYHEFQKEYSFTTYGRLDWKNKLYQETSIEELYKEQALLDEHFLIIWTMGLAQLLKQR